METSSTDEQAALQRHYLKKELLSLLVEEELAFIGDSSNLVHLGTPFMNKDEPPIPFDDSKIPILRFIFKKFVLTFPFLDPACQTQLWNVSFRNFLSAMYENSVSVLPDDPDATYMHKMEMKFHGMLTLLMSRAISCIQGEKSIGHDRIDMLSIKKQLSQTSIENKKQDLLIAVVAGVRELSYSTYLRNKKTYEYILKVQDEESLIYVARRYSDFTKLHHTLVKKFPSAIIPRLPAKDLHDTHLHDGSKFASLDTTQTPSSIGSTKENFSLTLQQERMRIGLNYYVNHVLQQDELRNSPEVDTFFHSNPFTPNENVQKDILLRQELDLIRTKERKKFIEIASERAKALDKYMDEFKRSLMESGGLTSLFTELKEKDSIKDLSPTLQQTLEWVRVNLASTIYDVFIAKEKSSVTFSQIKRMHSIFPYGVIKNIMRFSNPLSVMKRILDTLLAQPFGMKSLFQRLLSLSLNDNVRAIHKLISKYQSQVNNAEVLQKIQQQAENPCKEAQEIIRRNEMSPQDYLLYILVSDEVPPRLSEESIRQVIMDGSAWKEAMDSEVYPEDKTIHERAKRFGFTLKLMHLYAKQFNKKRSISLISEGSTGEMMKTIVVIFYKPLMKVYKAANVYTSVGDFEAFMEDMLRLVEDTQENPEVNPTTLVEHYIDLVKRHEDAFYNFVHRVYLHDSGLFSSLMEWIESIISFLHYGSAYPIDMDNMITGLSPEETDLLSQELKELVEWNHRKKSFLFRKNTTKYASGDESTIPAVNMDELGLDEEILAELRGDGDEEEEYNNSDIEQNEDRMNESFEYDPIMDERQRQKRKANRSIDGVPAKPEFKIISKLLPTFRDRIYPILARFANESSA
ncbi:mitochondrial DUF3818 and PXA domain conserved fungal protein [Schizosaccharomyces osmophilus]|uniref:Mitochondrial DUF3818 and PXA domain conserved fungal protein n=1 Tax=Schizosaccharomyces osmophilus TaxID=2545709 RepID=A0AAE9WCL1_9SCHI|nr:mitochondrial DUF3818 and PXA domain conserved fungal protein [Schizosaccharomyces osmophilus]WBW73134.1 mitochondrial DUF3818 and PXA domain conserved fungal protein [Schizosaccharomyces osmophilus]